MRAKKTYKPNGKRECLRRQVQIAKGQRKQVLVSNGIRGPLYIWSGIENLPLLGPLGRPYTAFVEREIHEDRIKMEVM
jgi:hypothetical protein